MNDAARTATLAYLDPTSPNVERRLFVPAVSDLHRKRIAFLDNGWSSFRTIGKRTEAALRDRFGIEIFATYAIPTSCAPQPGLLERVAAEADAAIVGLAN
jgi:hypothetical protein